MRQLYNSVTAVTMEADTIESQVRTYLPVVTFMNWLILKTFKGIKIYFVYVLQSPIV